MRNASREEDAFFSPFSTILRSSPKVSVIPYYSGLFYEFDEPAAWEVVWDLPAYVELCARVSPKSVLDAGCGSGRILHTLRRHYPDMELIGIDNSEAAGARFRSRCGDDVRFLHGDLLDGSDWSSEEVDLALLGNVTVNNFTDRESAVRALDNLRDAVRPGGHIVISAFGDAALQNFTELRNAVDAVAFVDRKGGNRLIWRGVDYDADLQLLRHNYFIEARAGDEHDFPGVLAAREERIWTSGEVSALAQERGLCHEGGVSTSVEGGGAQGWTVDALLFRRAG